MIKVDKLDKQGGQYNDKQNHTNKMDFNTLCEKYNLNMTESLLQTILDNGNRLLVIPPQGAMYTATEKSILPKDHVTITIDKLNTRDIEVINLTRDSNKVFITNMENLANEKFFDTDIVYRQLSVDEWTVFVRVLKHDTFIIRKSKEIDFTIDKTWLTLLDRIEDVACAYAVKLHCSKMYHVA